MTALTKWSALLVLFTLFLRLPAVIHPKSIDDEGGYAVVAHELLADGTLYRSALDRSPPLIFWLYALFFSTVGLYNWPLFHLIGVVWVLLTMGGLYAIGKTLFNREVGLNAALLYSIYTTSMHAKMLAFNGEVMMNLPIVWALVIAFKRTPSRLRPELALSGFLLGCAVLIKQPAGIAALPVGLYLLLPTYRAQRGLNRQDAIQQASLLVAGFVLALGIAALALAQQGILSDAIYWAISDHDIPHGPTDPIFWQLGIGMSLAFAVAWHPLVALCVSSAWKDHQKKLGYWQHLGAERATLLILVGCSFIGVSASGRFYPHYYLQLLPALVLLSAPVLTAIWAGAQADRCFWSQPRTLRVILFGTALAFLLNNAITLWQQRPENELSQYVREHSTPADKIFFWGQADYLYAEAQRRPASRYILSYPLTGYLFGSPLRHDPDHDTTDRILSGAWDTLQDDFRRSPPLFFVDTDPGTVAKKYPPSQYPFLKHLLQQDYDGVLTTASGIVYQRRETSPLRLPYHGRGTKEAR